jgi:hypothetical protein
MSTPSCVRKYDYRKRTFGNMRSDLRQGKVMIQKICKKIMQAGYLAGCKANKGGQGA